MRSVLGTSEMSMSHEVLSTLLIDNKSLVSKYVMKRCSFGGKLMANFIMETLNSYHTETLPSLSITKITGTTSNSCPVIWYNRTLHPLWSNLVSKMQPESNQFSRPDVLLQEIGGEKNQLVDMTRKQLAKFRMCDIPRIYVWLSFSSKLMAQIKGGREGCGCKIETSNILIKCCVWTLCWMW